MKKIFLLGCLWLSIHTVVLGMNGDTVKSLFILMESMNAHLENGDLSAAKEVARRCSEFSVGDRVQCFFALPEGLVSLDNKPIFSQLKNDLKLEMSKKFGSIRELFHYQMREYLGLPYQAVLLIIKDDDFSVDSEASVWHVLVCWLENDLTNREEYFQELMGHVRFVHMKSDYLTEVVPNTISYLRARHNRPAESMMEIEGCLNRHLDIARKTIADGRSSMVKKRPNFNNITDCFSLECTYINMSQLTQTVRYYSAPILAQGYEFSFFLRLEKINQNGPESPENLKIGGYLRRMCKIPWGLKHNLHVLSSVEVACTDDTKRRFSPSSIVFEEIDKAIGGSLMSAKENFQQVKDGACPIVVNDAIIATVRVEFLSDKSGNCVVSVID